MEKRINIPDNATNGDILKALFPKPLHSFEQCNDKGYSSVFMFNFENTDIIWNTSVANIDLDWWNAPYKENMNEL